MTDTANESMTAAEYREQAASEEEIHQGVIQWADQHSAVLPELNLLFHSPNGGSRHVAEATKLKRMGTRQGVPDLLLPAPVNRVTDDGVELVAYFGLALELKSADGRLRPKQKWWLKRFRENGWAVGVAYSFSEAITILTDYLDGFYEGQEIDLSGAEPPDHVQ